MSTPGFVKLNYGFNTMYFFVYLDPTFKKLVVHGQLNWKKSVAQTSKCTTRATRTFDFATPAATLISAWYPVAWYLFLYHGQQEVHISAMCESY